MTQKTHVYRLDITYPPGSTTPGWEPEGWDDDEHNNSGENGWFRWPKERMFLSASGAENRAGLLRHYGAAVSIRRSKPVEWDKEEKA